ncbi:MAG: HYR domain-containing protein [Acidobacteria bacterium]|nr:HYR domain-containing protein [Acidobacteriota bacterium]
MRFTVLSSFVPNTFLRRRFGMWLTICALALVGAHWLRAGQAAAGTITGVVFQDFNSNGVRETTNTVSNSGSGTTTLAIDRGIADVTVTAFDSSNMVAGTAMTGVDGNYSLTASGNAPYRIEFTTIPAGFQPGPVGTDSKTTVQFIPDNNASNISLGLVIPEEYCQDNPTLVTGCYVSGDQNNDNPVLVSFPYSAGSTRESGSAPFTDFDQPAHGNLSTARQAGTTWGLGYARSTKQLYAAAFMKRHSGYGPSGTGAVYQVNPMSGATTTYADLNAIFGANTAGTDAHDSTDFDRDNGNTGWDAVGKTSLGGVTVSQDDKKLYVMNLADRQLYELPLDNTPAVATVRRKAVPLNPPGCPAASDVRPFAVTINGGKIYVGMVCSAESTITQAQPDGDVTMLQAYVYTVDPVTLDFSASPVFQASLNYPRRCADSAQLGVGNCFSAAWHVWSPVYRNIGNGDGVGVANLGRGIYPQPMLTDLAFENGNLILGLRDRAGDQFGNATLDNPAENVMRYYGVSAGDTLKACGSAATGWTLESNGRCGGMGTAPQNTGEGPGGGEFYFRDESVPFTDEIFMGGMAQIPGHPDVVINSFDPIPIFDFDNLFDGGPRWHRNANGTLAKTYRIYNGTLGPSGPFGKANGLSDIVLLCDAAPIEIGNRIWQDVNGNGIQDAGEPGLSGIHLRLLKNGIQVGETTTGSNGEFYFNNSNVSPSVLPGMTYDIAVDRTQTALNGFTLTNANQDSSQNGDSRDSDAVVSGNDAVIRLTTGGAGESNHTFDLGFVQPGGPITITCPPSVTATITVAGATSAVVNYPTPMTTGSVTTVTCTPPSGSTFQLGTTTVSCVASNSAGFVTCSFEVIVQQQPPTITCPINMTVTATTSTGGVVTYPTPTATNGATVTCTPPSGSTFPIGTTTVTCTATNSAGSAACQFTVTLTPPVGSPMIDCPINMTVTATTSTGGVVTYPTPTATNGATVTCMPPSGSTFPIGTTTVTCTATNSAGSASCQFTVTLTPATQPPTITCPINMTVTATTSTGGVVTYPTPTATNGATVTCTPPSGSTFPIGTTTVTCTATNSAGSASCSFTVTLTPMMAKSNKCDTICFRSPQYYLLNLGSLPRGSVLIGGVNNNQPVSTGNRTQIALALRGNATGFGLTPLQRLNQEFVAAQLSVIAAGGDGSPVAFNAFWSMLSCYNLNFASVMLSNGVVLSPASMLNDLFEQTQLAIRQNRTADFDKLTAILDMLNGNDPLGRCGR